jgi:hypothetical protein
MDFTKLSRDVFKRMRYAERRVGVNALTRRSEDRLKLANPILPTFARYILF